MTELAEQEATLAQERESDREYLCQDFVSSLSVGLIILGWVWGVGLIASGVALFRSAIWLAPGCLIVLGAGSYYLAQRRVGWASAVALLAMACAVLLAAGITGHDFMLFGLAFVIIVAGVLTPPAVLAAVSLLAAGWVLVFQGSLSIEGWLTRILFLAIGLAFGLACLLWYSLHVALQLSWSSRQRALAQMREARQRRAELGRAVKALDEEYDRLQRLNRELVEARREAEEARQLKAEFAANGSHERRTPINLIVGFSEMMATAPESYGGVRLPPEYLGDVHAVYRSARHLQTLIDDILDLSRLDAKRLALTRELSDLGEVVAEAAQVVQELVARKNLKLIVQIEPNLPPLLLDRTRIRQVLLNLISNAVRFTDRGQITVSCGLYLGGAAASAEADSASAGPRPISLPTARYVGVSVADTGIGIRREDMDKVFEEFRQVDGSARRKYGGTGLGLAISKRFVELHGGWMWVESEVGEGSVFHFVLPAAEETWSRSRLVDTRPRPASAQVERRVVVLDEDPAVIRLFARYLHNRRVLGAADAAEALRLAAEHAPELLIATNAAPAEELLALQQRDPALAQARLSILSCGIPSERRRALALGMADYLVKPVSREQLLAAIARLGRPARRILAVEDEPNMMRLLGRMLAQDGSEATLVKAYSAEEAQGLLRAQPPDVVLLDLALPRMSGYELLEWMQRDETLRQVPVIVVTADTSLKDDHLLDATALTVARRGGLAVQELIALAELIAEALPSRYAQPGEVKAGPGAGAYSG